MTTNDVTSIQPTQVVDIKSTTKTTEIAAESSTTIESNNVTSKQQQQHHDAQQQVTKNTTNTINLNHNRMNGGEEMSQLQIVAPKPLTTMVDAPTSTSDRIQYTPEGLPRLIVSIELDLVKLLQPYQLNSISLAEQYQYLEHQQQAAYLAAAAQQNGGVVGTEPNGPEYLLNEMMVNDELKMAAKMKRDSEIVQEKMVEKMEKIEKMDKTEKTHRVKSPTITTTATSTTSSSSSLNPKNTTTSSSNRVRH